MDLQSLTIKSFHKGLLSKEFSALEIVQDYFRRIKDKDGEIGSYLSLLEDDAIQAAERVDLAIAKNENLPDLAGVPMAIKDNILIEGTGTTAGSKILSDYKASYDAGVIKRLKDKMAVFLGKTNLDEFAMGSSTENSGFQITKNPLDPERVPGGSSGGSAAAVAGGMALASLGSDTGGSIRQPAAFCGLVALKPTYGAVSRHGLIALSSSLDQIGPITKTVDDAAIIFEAIKSKDFYDATSFGSDSSDRPDLEKLKNLKVGVPKEYFSGSGLDKDVSVGMEKAMESLKSLGLKFEEITLPHTKYALSCYYIVMPVEASANLARYDGIRYERDANIRMHTNDTNKLTLKDIYFKTRGEGFGTETKRRILLGTFALSSGYYDAYYSKAQKVRRLIRNDFEEAFKKVDIIFAPTTPTPAFKIGEKTKDPLSMYLSDIFTIPVNLAGLPALSLPVRNFLSKEGLPVGFQLIGNYKKETDILGVGSYYEKING